MISVLLLLLLQLFKIGEYFLKDYKVAIYMRFVKSENVEKNEKN